MTGLYATLFSLYTVTKERLLHRHPVTPYEGQTLFGAVSATYLRGTRIFDGTSVTKAHGRFIHKKDA